MGHSWATCADRTLFGSNFLVGGGGAEELLGELLNLSVAGIGQDRRKTRDKREQKKFFGQILQGVQQRMASSSGESAIRWRECV